MNKKLPNLYKNNNIKNNTNKVESKVDERCLDTKLDYNTVKSELIELMRNDYLENEIENILYNNIHNKLF